METIGNGRITLKNRTSHRARTTRSARRNQRINPERSGQSSVISCVLVGGGGGGGGANYAQTAGGGGGGGEPIEFQFTTVSNGSYPIIIGAGGAGGVGWQTGGAGANSSAFGYTAVGGGGGGSYNTAATGGSSGGGEGAFQNYGAGTGIAGKGFDGGQALVVQNAAVSGGGGGGARGIGGDAASSIGGAGGTGYFSSITGLTYGGGEGGGGGTTGGSSSGGGGAGAFGENHGSAAPANRGGGGGGAMVNATNAPKNGGAGGAGTFIFSYVTGSLLALGGVITYANGMTIHTFTSSESLYIGPPKTVSFVGAGYDDTSTYVITSGELSAIAADEGDLIVAFGPYGGAVTGMTRTTFTWMYTMTIHWKIITASDLLSGFTCSPQLDYGPLSWAVYRGPSSVNLVYTGNATGSISTHAVNLPAPTPSSMGFVHYITDRDGTTLGTPPTGYTSRVGSATGVFTGQIADRLSGNPTIAHTATWTGFTASYDQGACAFELLP